MDLKRIPILFAIFVSIFWLSVKPALATHIGKPCCSIGLTYDIETDKCAAAGWGALRYEISCERPAERCQPGDPDNRGTCVSAGLPSPTPGTYTPGYCNINPEYLDTFGIYNPITISSAEIEDGKTYAIVMPDGMVIRAPAEKNDEIRFAYLYDPNSKGGTITVKEYTLGSKIICVGRIRTSNDKKIDPTCDSGKGINTAIGCIPTYTLNAFVGWILGKVVFIASGIAFLLMAFGAIQIITSAGNPDKMKTGSQLITSALSGLIFIILSVFLLKLIGVDILQIPNFGN